jgi:hypothetical protein
MKRLTQSLFVLLCIATGAVKQERTAKSNLMDDNSIGIPPD